MRRLLAVSELVQLQPVLVALDGRELAVVLVGEEVHAFSPTCTHRAAPLVNGAVTWKHRILCPWHLGTFDLRSGAATAGPCQVPLPTYRVTVVDGEVLLDTAVLDTPVVDTQGFDTQGFDTQGLDEQGDDDAQGDLRPDEGRRAHPGPGGPDLRPDGTAR